MPNRVKRGCGLKRDLGTRAMLPATATALMAHWQQV